MNAHAVTRDSIIHVPERILKEIKEDPEGFSYRRMLSIRQYLSGSRLSREQGQLDSEKRLRLIEHSD